MREIGKIQSDGSIISPRDMFNAALWEAMDGSGMKYFPEHSRDGLFVYGDDTFATAIGATSLELALSDPAALAKAKAELAITHYRSLRDAKHVS